MRQLHVKKHLCGAPRLDVDVIVVTPTRLLGDGLRACLIGHADLSVVAVVDAVEHARRVLATTHADLLLIDVTLGIDLFEVHALALQHHARSCWSRWDWPSNAKT